MIKPINTTDFTAKERDLIRREFQERFGSHRPLASGIPVRRWVTGPNKGQAKFPLPVQTMLDRGLASFADDGKMWPTVHFTPAGWQALRRMADDGRALPPDEYRHLLDELAATLESAENSPS